MVSGDIAKVFQRRSAGSAPQQPAPRLRESVLGPPPGAAPQERPPAQHRLAVSVSAARLEYRLLPELTPHGNHQPGGPGEPAGDQLCPLLPLARSEPRAGPDRSLGGHRGRPREAITHRSSPRPRPRPTVLGRASSSSPRPPDRPGRVWSWVCAKQQVNFQRTVVQPPRPGKRNQ
ncbi:hypothetical protein AB1E18_016455 [Capra hircus]